MVRSTCLACKSDLCDGCKCDGCMELMCFAASKEDCAFSEVRRQHRVRTVSTKEELTVIERRESARRHHGSLVLNLTEVSLPISTEEGQVDTYTGTCPEFIPIINKE